MDSDDDLAWIAGYFEGEANFWKQTSGRGYLRVGIKVASTDEDVLRHLERLIPESRVRGPFKPHRSSLGKKPFWTWDLGVRQVVVDLVRQIRPWMGKRRTGEIDALLAHHASRSALRIGRMYHLAGHGTRTRFGQGCRCAECRRAGAAYQSEGRRLRAMRARNAGVSDARILCCLDGGGRTVYQIAEVTQLHEADIRADLKRLEGAGLVWRHRARATEAWFWEVAPGNEE